MLDDIPAPQVLSPDRVLRADRDDMSAEDHRSQAQLLDKALHESCSYAQRLWNDLAAARGYLYESLPAQPSSSGAAPHGPGDDEGWDRWEDAFAEITSILAGPHGDSGFGRSSAKVLAQGHRIVTAVEAQSDDSDGPAEDSDGAAEDSDGAAEDSDGAAEDSDGAADDEAPRAAGAVSVDAAGSDVPALANVSQAEAVGIGVADPVARSTIVGRVRDSVLFAAGGAAVAALVLRRWRYPMSSR